MVLVSYFLIISSQYCILFRDVFRFIHNSAQLFDCFFLELSTAFIIFFQWKNSCCLYTCQSVTLISFTPLFFGNIDNHLNVLKGFVILFYICVAVCDKGVYSCKLFIFRCLDILRNFTWGFSFSLFYKVLHDF